VKILETRRLVLRELTLDDAPFILRLLNDPAWLRFIGDRGVRTVDDAHGYLENGPLKMYRERGFGLWLVELKPDATPVGICGLLKRETLSDVDLGFAFLPEFRGRGYGYEAAAATLAHGRNAIGLNRIVAVTAPDNTRSIALLEKLGLRFEKTVRLKSDGPETRLYATMP
jgi:RimJ/RimL family protein N-acetyltransferase